MRVVESPRTRRGVDQRDDGLTLIELSISMVILGMIVSVLAVAVSIALSASPATETRIDDARATRSLATWLSSDTTSTPPFLPEQAQGGIVTDTSTSAPDNNDCGAGGTNLLHLQWTETTSVAQTFVANYRFVVDGTDATIIRVLCSRVGSDPFASITRRVMTSGLSPSHPPTVEPVFDPSGDVSFIRFTLTGSSGEVVRIETGSRNPADFFPAP